MWLITSLALAGNQPSVDAVHAFVKAGDSKSVAELQTVLHDEFRVVAQMPDGLSVLDKATYIDLIDKGVIGGGKRTAQIDSVITSGPLVTVKGTLTSSDADFDCTWTVVQNDASWQVIQDLVLYTPKAK